MNGTGSFPIKPNTYDNSTEWRDSLAGENTNSGYYEEIPAAHSNVHSTTTSHTRGTVVSVDGNHDVMRDVSHINHGTIYESIDDAIPKVYSSCKSQGEDTHTDNVTYDDVIEVMVCYARTNDPVNDSPHPSGDNETYSYGTIHEPITLMTAADETVLVDNCIYVGADQELHWREHCNLVWVMHAYLKRYVLWN